ALGVARLVVDDRVHRDDHVVGGDDLLRGHVHDLLAHVHQAHGLEEGQDDPQARVDGGLVLAELLDDAALVGPHDLEALDHDDEDHQGDQAQDDDGDVGGAHGSSGVGGTGGTASAGNTTTRVPRTSTTFTAVPTGISEPSPPSARPSPRSMRTVPRSWAPSIAASAMARWPISRLDPMPSAGSVRSRRCASWRNP